jgi:hypothetical protein
MKIRCFSGSEIPTTDFPPTDASIYGPEVVRKEEPSVRMVNCVCMYSGVQLELKLMR